MRRSRIIAAAVVLVLAAGCLPDTDGVNPPSDRFIYPVGLAGVAGGERLMVLNSNFDLEYNSGTLMLIDVSDLESRFDVPSSEVSRDGQYLFVDESELTIKEETIRVGAYASDLELTPSGDRAIIPVRGERAILLVDVGGPEDDDLLGCGEGGDRRCDSAHRVESNDDHSLPIEPYEVAALDYPEPVSGNTTTLGFATHLAGGEVSLFVVRDGSVGGQAEGELIDVLGGVVPGASGIAVNPVSREVYVSGRSQQAQVAVLKVLTDSQTGQYSYNPFFGQVSHIDLGNEMYAGTDGRGLAVTSSGDKVYMATRTPSALLELDADAHGMVGMTSVCTDPSVVALYEDDAGTASEADDATYAFVLCFLIGKVFIVDTELMMVLAVQSVGEGPHAIWFDRSRRLAYVANFSESTISIIEVRPPYFNLLRDDADRIVKIGKPRLPEGHD
jgi:hypothetical protein